MWSRCAWREAAVLEHRRMYRNLKLQLWQSGIRQNRLAKMLQVDETLLSRIINGFREPDKQLRARIAAALGTEEGWLFQCEENPAPPARPSLNAPSTPGQGRPE